MDMTLAQVLLNPEPASLVSWLKPTLMVALVLAWARVVSELDKDAEYFYLPRFAFNSLQLGVGALAFIALLWIPIFWVGLPIAIVMMVSSVWGYVYYRNSQVPEKNRWTLSLDMLRSRYRDMERARAMRSAAIWLENTAGESLELPSGDDPRVEAHLLFENLMDFALPRLAENVEIIAEKQRGMAAVKVDGVRYPQDAVEPEKAAKLIDYIKTAAGMDPEERRKKQTGGLWVGTHELGKHRLAIETSGSTRGMRMVLDIDPSARSSIKVDHLGFTANQLEQLKPTFTETTGIVLVSAPHQHGLSTTLSSLLDQHDPYMSNVLMIQDPDEGELEGVSYHPIAPGTPVQKIEEKLGSVFRTEPEVIMLPEIYSEGVAQLVAQHAEQTRFYIGFREQDTFTLLKQWTKLVGDRRSANKYLHGIMAQRLIRRLCTTCRTSYKPDAKALKKLNLPAEKVKKLYHVSGQVMVRDKPQPCPQCFGMGYRGRVAVFEMMLLDEKARQLAIAKEMERLRSHVRKQKMLWLQESALTKVVEGVTDIKEVTRVLEGKPRAGGKDVKDAKDQAKAKHQEGPENGQAVEEASDQSNEPAKHGSGSG